MVILLKIIGLWTGILFVSWLLPILFSYIPYPNKFDGRVECLISWNIYEVGTNFNNFYRWGTGIMKLILIFCVCGIIGLMYFFGITLLTHIGW